MFLYHEASGQESSMTLCLAEVPGGSTRWRQDNYSVWSHLLECGTMGKICCLCLTCV